MPTIQDQKDLLADLKRELEAGGNMSENEAAAIVLTAAAIDAEGMAWIEVMPTAEKVRNGSWYFTVTASDLETLVAYIEENPDRIPIDYDHSGAELQSGGAGSSRAAGWFTGEARTVSAGEQNPGGDVQDHPSVWARVKWTPTAAQEIRDGVFRFISPEWHFEEKDTKTGLMTKLKDLAAATLTNRPFFKQLSPVTATELRPEQLEAVEGKYGPEVAAFVAVAASQLDPSYDELTALLDAAGASGSPSAADQGKQDLNEKETTVAEDQNQVTDYMKMLGLDETVDPKHRLAAAFRDKDSQIETLKQQVTELTTTASEKNDQAEALTARLEELEQKDRSRDIEVILDQAVTTGRVLPAEKETLAEVFVDDVAGLRRMVASRPASMFSTEPRGTGASRTPDRYDADPDVASYVRGMQTGGDPVDTEQAKVHLLAMDILKDQGKATNYTDEDYVAAYEAAASRV